MAGRRKILFVDEDSNVLEGLRRSFRSLRQEWALAFAKSGTEALEILNRVPFDVVVSDIAVSGMGGAQLLNEVMKKYPNIVRIVLAGETDKETAMKSVQPAHQYLRKPYDSEKLKTLLIRAMGLKDRLADEHLKSLVSRLDTVPSMPALYTRLMEEMASEDASIQKVGEIISSDVGMTAKILQLVNSAFFGVLQNVTSPAQAVSLLGLETIQGLVLSVQIFSQFDTEKIKGIPFGKLWDHSMLVGVFSKEIARQEKMDRDGIGKAFMGGILHDSGKLILAANLPERYREVLTLIQNEGVHYSKAELEVFGTTHAEVGAYLLGLWGLPDAIIEAIAFHHKPTECTHTGMSSLTMVHAADAIAYSIDHDSPGPERQWPVNSAYLEKLNLTDRMEVWYEHCMKFVEPLAV